MGSVPGSGRSPGGGHGIPLQYSCLGNPMDRGDWWATVHRVAESQTRLKPLSTAQHIQTVFPCLKKSGSIGQMHFQDSFNNNYAKPMCSGEMKTRWWVFRADKNPTNRLLCCLSVTFLVCCVNAVTSLQRALWPASKCDGGWRAGVVAAPGSVPPKPSLPGAHLPALLAEHWEQEGELAAGVSRRGCGRGLGLRAGSFVTSECTWEQKGVGADP